MLCCPQPWGRSRFGSSEPLWGCWWVIESLFTFAMATPGIGGCALSAILKRCCEEKTAHIRVPVCSCHGQNGLPQTLS